MLIDCHTHVLGMGLGEEFQKTFNRQALMCVYRAKGLLPSHRLPTEEDWKNCNVSFEQTDPEKLLKAYETFDKVVILGWSPHYFEDIGLGGTVDTTGVTGVIGPPHPEKCNDYIAALVKKCPDKLIGFASVNPNYKGPKTAVKELERAIYDLKLQGLKLYPTYQHWSPDDRDKAFPIFEKAQELGIPVLVHMSGSTLTSAPMKYSKPMLLDDVGNEFRKLRLIIAHMGIPWVDEAKYMLTKHANFYGDLSYFIGSIDRETLYRFLLSCKPFFVPLEKLFFGSDYPAYDTMALVKMLKTVNEEAERLGKPKIPEEEIQGILGDNFAKFMGII
jgi:predicted TIM-barrel fold metal-dependent hydrolase